MKDLTKEEGISVVICCYNSAWIIERTLLALKNQSIRDGIAWEIVLVDNNCTDETVSKALSTMADFAIPFKVIVEKEPGLANARRAGINSAKFSVVTYCDDDNLLCPNYLDSMYEIMMSDNQIGACGGKGIAEFEAEPDQIVLNNLGNYAIGSQKNNDCWLYGAGLTLRSAIVKEIYDNQRCYLVGRKGGQLLSGDDSELVMAIVLRGYKIMASDDVYYTHVLKAERLTEDYYKRLLAGLLLPVPVFNVFRAVIYTHPFTSIVNDYLKNVKSIAWSYVHSKSPGAKNIRSNSKQLVQAYHFWGIWKLWHIYKDWKNIKMCRSTNTFT